MDRQIDRQTVPYNFSFLDFYMLSLPQMKLDSVSDHDDNDSYKTNECLEIEKIQSGGSQVATQNA